jgi:hypothetical protein
MDHSRSSPRHPRGDALQSDGSKRLTEERRALIARYLLDAPGTPAAAGPEAPMRREALEEVARQAAVADERTRREAEQRVAERVALAVVAEKARRKADDQRIRREALEQAAWRAAEAEAYAKRKVEDKRAKYEALDSAARRAAAAVEEQAWLEAEQARELREAAEKAAQRALAAEEEARRRAAEERARRQAAEQAAAQRRDVEAEGAWSSTHRGDHELTTRLLQALTRLQTESDADATRLQRLTWAVVCLGFVVALLTIVVFLQS